MSLQSIQLVERAGVENDPKLALAILLYDCIAHTGASTGRLYLLDLAKAAYVQLTAPLETPAAPLSLIAANANDDPMLRAAIQDMSILRSEHLSDHANGQSVRPGAQSRLIVPLVRDRVCLGVIDLDSDLPHHFTEAHAAKVHVAALVGMLLCEKDGVLNLLKELQEPVDYHQGFNEFLDNLMLVIAAASKMPRIALREFRDDTLHCLKSFGFTDQTEDDLHLSPLVDYPPFAKVVASRQTFLGRRVDVTCPHFLYQTKPEFSAKS